MWALPSVHSRSSYIIDRPDVSRFSWFLEPLYSMFQNVVTPLSPLRDMYWIFRNSISSKRSGMLSVRVGGRGRHVSRSEEEAMMQEYGLLTTLPSKGIFNNYKINIPHRRPYLCGIVFFSCWELLILGFHRDLSANELERMAHKGAPLSWRWKQKVPPKHWYLPNYMAPYLEKTVILVLTSVRNISQEPLCWLFSNAASIENV
jgi:hypothetical protein